MPSGHKTRQEGDMKCAPAIFVAAAAALSAPTTAYCTPLTVVNVNAPKINCVFDASCKIVVNDSSGSLQFTQFVGGFLQSRTFPVGKAGTPGAGKIAYLYRLDLTQANKFADCVVGLVINFGPITKLNYLPNTPADVFVVTQGGLGSDAIASAEQDGDVITFTFSTPLCGGQTSYFFGLASAKAPQPATATLFGFGAQGVYETDARTPQH
jgi:hypothetical protein